MATNIRYAGFPSALIFEKADTKSKVLKQLLWGDWVQMTGNAQGSFRPVHARGCNGFMTSASLQSERLLEMVRCRGDVRPDLSTRSSGRRSPT
jgi:hypothetical protein